MAVASDASGVLPMWAQKMGLPGAIAKDVGLFFKVGFLHADLFGSMELGGGVRKACLLTWRRCSGLPANDQMLRRSLSSQRPDGEQELGDFAITAVMRFATRTMPHVS